MNLGSQKNHLEDPRDLERLMEHRGLESEKQRPQNIHSSQLSTEGQGIGNCTPMDTEAMEENGHGSPGARLTNS